MLFNLAHPFRDSGEGVAVADIIDYDDALGLLVEAWCYREIALLTGSVPDLQLAETCIDAQRATPELHTYRRPEVLLKLILLRTVHLFFDLVSLTMKRWTRHDLPAPKLPITETLKV